MIRRWFLFAFFLSVAVHAPAHEVLLLPLTATRDPIPGAAGSRWVIEQHYRNTLTVPVTVGNGRCTLGLCGFPFSPGFTVGTRGDGQPEVLFVSSPGSGANFKTLTVVRDASRGSETFGAQIPTVREQDLQNDRVELIRVSADENYRRNLRLYAVYTTFSDEPTVLRVRIFDAVADENEFGPERLLGQEQFTLRRGEARTPGYISIGDLDSLFPAIRGTSAVRVVVERLSGPARIWAFVTLTNNNTHHVTVVAP